MRRPEMTSSTLRMRGHPLGASSIKDLGCLGCSGCRTEMSLCSTIVLMSRILIYTVASFLFFFPKDPIPRENTCGLMKHVQGKQPPLWPAGTVGVGLWILQGDPVGRAWDDLITLGKHCVCACVCVCVCVCVYVQTCFSSLTWLNRPCRTTPSERPFEAHVTSLCHLSSNFLNRPLKFLGGGNRRRRRAERETNGWCVCVSGVCGGSVVSIYRVWSCFSEAGNPDSIRAGFDLVKMSSLAHSFVCSLHGLYSAKELWKYLTVKQRGRICALSNP